MNPLKAFFFFTMLLSSGFFCFCNNSNEQASGANANTPSQKQSEYLVTFIELGSVNCIPCRMMQPVMEEIKKEYADRVEVVFHDVWTQQGEPYAQKYQIRAIPTQVFLDKDGKEYFRHTGFFPKEEIIKILKLGGVE